MILSITYQELQRFVAEKLDKNVELQYAGNRTIKLTIHTTVKKIVTINVQLNAELDLSMYDNDLYIDYRMLPIENMKSGRLAGLIDSVAPDVANIALNYLCNKYPQYSKIIEKVPAADRLRIHLAAIPQVQNVLQYVVVESIVPQEDGLQITAQMKK